MPKLPVPLLIRAPLFDANTFTWPPSDRILILGQTGAGKSWLGKRLLDQVYGKVRIVVFQSKPRVGVLDKLAVRRLKTLKGLPAAINKEPMVILKPDPVLADDRGFTEDFSEMMLYERHPLIVYIDEEASFTGFSPLPAKKFAALVTKGRELDKGIIMAAQEPAYLPRMVYAESQIIFRMYVHGLTNLKAIRDKLPAPLADTPLPPGAHAFVMWDIRDRNRAYAYRKVV